MKIVSVDVIEIARDKRLQGMQCVICQIHTDEGISGIGETGVAIGVGGSAAASLLKEMALCHRHESAGK